MDTNVDQIASELAALTQRFGDLGAKLGETARALDTTGAPPASGLVEALAGARGQFVQLRAEALSAANAAGVPPPTEPESLNEIEPLLVAIGEALRGRARLEALGQAQQAAVKTIDRVLEIIHQDDPAFPTLLACHARAREARAEILALTELDSDDARQVTDRVRAFADLLTMVENQEGLDDDRYAELEESVSRGFGRALAVAAARGRIGFEGEFVEPPPAPEPVVEPSEAPPMETEAVMASVLEAITGEAPSIESEEGALSEESGPASETIAVEEPAPGAEAAADPSAPDETAQWWLAAWARWSGWKSSHDFAAAVREELGKYPYLLSVPIQKSPEYEDGLLAYGYSILMDHVEKQNAGCVGKALNSLKPGQTRRVGAQLYEYLITEGRLRETYAEFVKNTLLAAVPEPGVWFQFRILESKEDTRILQRPSSRIGDTELSGQRLASDSQRYNEHKFKMTLGPLTTRFVLVSADVKEARGAGFKLVGDGAPSDSGWVVSVSAGNRVKNEARRITEDGLHVPGLGKDHQALWVAVFNPDTAADRRYELSVFLRKDGKSPFRTKG